jgi:hypothetical protein
MRWTLTAVAVAGLLGIACRDRRPPEAPPRPRVEAPTDRDVRGAGREVGEAAREVGEKVREFGEGVKEGVGGSGPAENDRRVTVPPETTPPTVPDRR